MKFSLKTIFIVFLVLGCIVSPAAARGPTIKDILPDDFIFRYEEGLDLTGLTSDGQVQSLRKIVDGDPDTPLLPVGSAVGSWDVPDYLEEDDLGTYAVINGSGVWEGSVYLTEPELKLEVTLAEPYHSESVEGLNLPEDTAIAFKITSADVGNYYHAGDDYPAKVDVLITLPGGAESTVFGGVQLKDITIDAPIVYTDDPGKPGASTLSGLEKGLYEARVRWSAPKEFDDYAEDSNIITFSVDDGTAIDITPTPTPAPTTATPTPTGEPTEEPTETMPPTPVETETLPTTAPPTTMPTEEPSPTATPLSGLVIAASLAGALLLARYRN